MKTEGKKYSDEAQDFISNKIRKLKSEGKEQGQAVAIAHEMARKKGYDIPKKSSHLPWAKAGASVDISGGNLASLRSPGIRPDNPGPPLWADRAPAGLRTSAKPSKDPWAKTASHRKGTRKHASTYALDESLAPKIAKEALSLVSPGKVGVIGIDDDSIYIFAVEKSVGPFRQGDIGVFMPLQAQGIDQVSESYLRADAYEELVLHVKELISQWSNEKVVVEQAGIDAIKESDMSPEKEDEAFEAAGGGEETTVSMATASRRQASHRKHAAGWRFNVGDPVEIVGMGEYGEGVYQGQTTVIRGRTVHEDRPRPDGSTDHAYWITDDDGNDVVVYEDELAPAKDAGLSWPGPIPSNRGTLPTSEEHEESSMATGSHRKATRKHAGAMKTLGFIAEEVAKQLPAVYDGTAVDWALVESIAKDVDSPAAQAFIEYAKSLPEDEFIQLLQDYRKELGLTGDEPEDEDSGSKEARVKQARAKQARSKVREGDRVSIEEGEYEAMDGRVVSVDSKAGVATVQLEGSGEDESNADEVVEVPVGYLRAASSMRSALRMVASGIKTAQLDREVFKKFFADNSDSVWRTLCRERAGDIEYLRKQFSKGSSDLDMKVVTCGVNSVFDLEGKFIQGVSLRETAEDLFRDQVGFSVMAGKDFDTDGIPTKILDRAFLDLERREELTGLSGDEKEEEGTLEESLEEREVDVD